MCIKNFTTTALILFSYKNLQVATFRRQKQNFSEGAKRPLFNDYTIASVSQTSFCLTQTLLHIASMYRFSGKKEAGIFGIGRIMMAGSGFFGGRILLQNIFLGGMVECPPSYRLRSNY